MVDQIEIKYECGCKYFLIRDWNSEDGYGPRVISDGWGLGLCDKHEKEVIP